MQAVDNTIQDNLVYKPTVQGAGAYGPSGQAGERDVLRKVEGGRCRGILFCQVFWFWPFLLDPILYLRYLKCIIWI